MPGREETLQMMREPWDVIVVGGGITGAGVLREAAHRGLRCLLLEQRDYAWGTSSRSGKLVHGGLRYLKQGQVKTTWHSVREREKLLRQYPGLVEPLDFLWPIRRGAAGTRAMRLGLAVYDLVAGRKSCRRCAAPAAQKLVPGVDGSRLDGAFQYRDAGTDDARLVLRVLGEARALGAVTLNYARVEEVLTGRSGRVRGVVVRDMPTGITLESPARVVISATGAWAEELRGRQGDRPRLRRLRGSHLVFPRHRLPLSLAVSFPHPRDRRPVYNVPWEGVTLVGTTDVDHRPSLEDEPCISPAEKEYLLEGVGYMFPALGLTAADIVSTFAGVRAVVNTGRRDPSKESREHVIWDDNGLVTVTGGKLTTFSLQSRQALRRAGKYLDGPAAGPARGGENKEAKETFTSETGLECTPLSGLDAQRLRRLTGRYGPDTPALLASAGPGGLETVAGTETLWAELTWAAHSEAVVHLDDLLLRRTRLGHILPAGGAGLAGRLRDAACSAPGWDHHRWTREWQRYTTLWHKYYGN